jgi:hypothetical protein
MKKAKPSQKQDQRSQEDSLNAPGPDFWYSSDVLTPDFEEQIRNWIERDFCEIPLAIDLRNCLADSLISLGLSIRAILLERAVENSGASPPSKVVQTAEVITRDFISKVMADFIKVAIAAPTPEELPKEAPELYVGNRGGGAKGENIVQFLRRVWMPWIEAGLLSRAALRELDSSAYKAIENWMRQKPWPEDLALLKKSEQNAKFVSMRQANPEFESYRRAFEADRKRRYR